ncbi:MAG: transglycosylase SLT domain-containing protein [Treponema sp.]|nr:transglycosylase SLT domain-containing protein [Treponema sp.]
MGSIIQTRLVPVLLLCALSSLRAEPDNGLPQTIDRPQRSVRADIQLPPSHSPAISPSLLLTSDALEQPLTRRYIIEYSSPRGIAWLTAVMQKGSLYLPYIKEEITRRGLPPELAYLPLVESNYLASARSKSGAAGLWQFMMNSIGPYNMQVTDMVDERRDFRKSTIAALRKLEENYNILGNWPLALAAYNAGLGGVSRAAKQAQTRDYWALCGQAALRQETIHYVPKLLAVAYIVSQPRRFGLDLWPEAIAWTAVPAPKQASLDLIAAETGADRELLGRLNPELLHGVTPPIPGYEIKVPIELAAPLAGLFDREDFQLLRLHRYQVQYGDTLLALARQYGVSLGLIEEYNPGILNRFLKTGETITIPALIEAIPIAKTKTAGKYPFDGTHLVQWGDTFWSLALRYGVGPRELALENGMELNQILPEGKTLKVPIIEIIE